MSLEIYAGAMFVQLPLLNVQHELYRVPRGQERFETYIKLMTGPDNTLALPLTVPNPAAKAHVLGRLEDLLAFELGELRYGFSTTLLWAGESYTAASLTEQVLATCH